MKIRLQTPPKPDPGRLTFFLDPTKAPGQKDSEGATLPIGLTGEPVTLDEGSAPTPDADGVWLYSKDVGGISEFFVMDGDGNEIQVTNAGGLEPAVIGSGAQFWTTLTGLSEFTINMVATSGIFTAPTGLILTPTPGQASIVHFRGIMAVLRNSDGSYGTLQNSGFVQQFVGWIAFSSAPGTPDVRRQTSQMRLISQGGWEGIFADEATNHGVSILSTGEVVLNLSTNNYFWANGRILASSINLPADLIIV